MIWSSPRAACRASTPASSSRAARCWSRISGSANGTYVDEERIDAPTPLTPQSQVVLGDYAIKLKAGARSASGARRAALEAAAPEVGRRKGAPEATRAMPSVKPARPPGRRWPSASARLPGRPRGPARRRRLPVLRGLTGPWANKTYPLKSKLLVGRSPPAAVLLEDDSISRKHAEVERNARGAVFLRDLGSANGTLLNGERLGQEPVEVQPGDIIQFGMVEMVYESGEEASGRRRRARPAAARLRRRGKGDPSDAPPAQQAQEAARGGRRGRGPAAGGGHRQAAHRLARSRPGRYRRSGDDQANPQEQVQELLEPVPLLRLHGDGQRAAVGQGRGGVRARRSTSIRSTPRPTPSSSASSWRRRPPSYFSQGAKMLQRLKEDDALDLLRKIPKESLYFRRAKLKVDEAMEQVKKRALDDCKRYLRDSQWAAAVPRCDRYMGFWCQGMSTRGAGAAAGLHPRAWRAGLAGSSGARRTSSSSSSSRPGSRMDPRAEPWKCPVTDFGAKEVASDPEAQVKKMFKDRYPNPYMNAAMFDYWGGRGNEALAKLQKVRSNYEQAALHGEVDMLIKDVCQRGPALQDGLDAAPDRGRGEGRRAVR